MTERNMGSEVFGTDHNADEEVLLLNETITDLAARVILYDDDEHTMDEVALQIMKAIACNAVRANVLTWEVHTRGKAVIYSGDMSECLRVSGILEEIGLHTQVEM